MNIYLKYTSGRRQDYAKTVNGENNRRDAVAAAWVGTTPR